MSEEEHGDEPVLAYFGAYWGHREQSAEEVATDLHEFLTRLAEITPLTREGWAFWKQDPGTFDGLLNMVRAGRNRYDEPPREIIKELGFQVSLRQANTDFRICAGGYSDWVGNSLTLSESYYHPGALVRQGMCEQRVARRMLELIVTSFAPEWSLVSTNRMRQPQLDVVRGQPSRREPWRHPVVGWMTYISADLIPAGGDKLGEPFAGGQLIQTDGELFDDSVVTDAKALFDRWFARAL